MMPRGRKYYRKVKRYGRTFRTRAGRLGRYVYVNGRKVAFEGVKSGARSYVKNRTYRSMKRRWG